MIYRATLLLLFFVSSGVISGCTGASVQDISASDRRTVFGALRLDMTTPRADPEMIGTTMPMAGVELDFSYSESDLNQDIGAGQAIALDNVTILGPTRADIDAEIRGHTLSGKAGGLFGGIVGVAGIGGVSVTTTDIEVKAGPVTDREQFTTFGFVFGGEIFFQVTRVIRPYGRFTYHSELDHERDLEQRRFEVGVELSPQPNIGFFMGWRWWIYDADVDDDFLFGDIDGVDDSDLELRFEGFLFGLVIRFG